LICFINTLLGILTNNTRYGALPTLFRKLNT
jgi:hypothetical protein